MVIGIGENQDIASLFFDFSPGTCGSSGLAYFGIDIGGLLLHLMGLSLVPAPQFFHPKNGIVIVPSPGIPVRIEFMYGNCLLQ